MNTLSRLLTQSSPFPGIRLTDKCSLHALNFYRVAIWNFKPLALPFTASLEGLNSRMQPALPCAFSYPRMHGFQILSPEYSTWMCAGGCKQGANGGICLECDGSVGLAAPYPGGLLAAGNKSALFTWPVRLPMVQNPASSPRDATESSGFGCERIL